MKLLKPIRQKLIEAILFQTLLIPSEDTTRDEKDSFGYTKAERKTLAETSYGFGYENTAYIFAVQYKISSAHAQDYIRRCREEAGESDNFNLPNLCAIWPTGDSEGTYGRYALVVTHGLKGELMASNGQVDRYTVIRDQFRPATQQEVTDMVNNFTEQQLTTIFSHPRFNELAVQVLTTEDEDDDDGDVPAPATPTPSPVLTEDVPF